MKKLSQKRFLCIFTIISVTIMFVKILQKKFLQVREYCLQILWNLLLYGNRIFYAALKNFTINAEYMHVTQIYLKNFKFQL